MLDPQGDGQRSRALYNGPFQGILVKRRKNKERPAAAAPVKAK